MAEAKTSQPTRKPQVTRAVATVPKQQRVVTRPTEIDLEKFPNLMNLEQNLKLLEYAFSKMEPGVDYGTVPGITKPFLKIPGTERLQQVFGLRLELEDTDLSAPEQDYFRHKIIAKAFYTDKETGEMVYLGMGVGTCSTRESKYRYRWLSPKEIPTQLKAGMTVTLTNHKTNELYETIDMQKWVDANGAGSAKMSKFGLRCRFPNEDTADLDNTVIKQAAKRARADVVQNVTGAHRMFARTEDVEAVGLDAVVAAEVVEEALEPELYFEGPSPVAKSKPTPATPPPVDPSKRLCPIHPGSFHIKVPTKDGGVVWAHKLEGQFSESGRPKWCIEDQAIERAKLQAEKPTPAPDAPKQGTLPTEKPNDIDSVNVKDNNEFLTVLNEICGNIGYGEPELTHFLQNNYPTSGVVPEKLPVAVRKSILKDLYAIYKKERP